MIKKPARDFLTCRALHSLLQAARRSAGVLALIAFVLPGDAPVPPISRDHC